MIYNKICVFDFETDGKNPYECSPVQLSAVMIDPIRLEIIPNSKFNAYLRPEKLSVPSDAPYAGSDILEWHGKVKGVSADVILSEWKKYPEQQESWKNFISYLEKYHLNGKKSQFTAPIACGYNILRFDMHIIDRLSGKYKNINKEKESNIFHPRDKIDIMNIAFLWLANEAEVRSLSLDSLRDYLGIDKTNAHDAYKDVSDCAEILIRFLKLHRNLAKKITFKDAFKAHA